MVFRVDPVLRDGLQQVLGTGIRLDRELGGGGMSRVFLATDLALDRRVVVKVLSPDQSAGVSGGRFRREIQLIAQLQHPHIVPILSAGDVEGTLYYVMPFLAGESLRTRMSREGPLEVPDALGILRETLDALAFAHSHGVIHRDIKPENVLIGGGHAVVADFGVSKALQDSGSVSSAGIALGTPAYMAPEQVVADPTADHRADLYAVAVVAYEMLTGARPFSGTPSRLLQAHLADAPTPLKQRRSDVPDAVADIVMRALSKDPEERPQSAREMMAALQTDATPGGTRAGAAAAGPPRTAGAARRSNALWFAATAAAVIAAAGAWFSLRPTVIASAQSLAIAPFSVADGDTALVRLGQNLVTTMSANLDGIGELRVADAMSVLSHARSTGSLLSVEAAVDIARKLGVRSAGYGTLVRAGTAVQADFALYDVRAPTRAVVRVSATVPIDSIAALTDSLTWKLLREIWAKGRAPTPNVASISTHSPVALREFLEGERLFERFDPTSAAEAYKRAIAADTTFWFAHYQYVHARRWFGNPVDTTIKNRLSRHLSALPERERLLLYAIDSTPTVADRQQKLSELLVRYPDYAPALMEYGDFVAHWAVFAGWDVRDAIPYFKRLTELMPSDLASLGHLGGVCLAVGDRTCAQQVLVRYDSILKSDTVPLDFPRAEVRNLAFVLHRPSRNWADSLAKVVIADRLVPSVLGFANVGGIFAEQPDLLIEQDRLYNLLGAQSIAEQVRPARFFASLGRGNPASFDSIAAWLPFVPSQFRAQFRPAIVRALILFELQGLREPSAGTAEEALTLVAKPGATSGERAESRWIVGASALLRGDSVLLRTQLSELARDTSAVARTAARSLEAIRLGRSGKHAEAAESLLVIEQDHGEHFRQRVWVALVADRLLGAGWLIESRRYAPADSLLRYTQAIHVTPDQMMMAQATFGTAQLLRSQIAEKLENKDDAIAFAKIFLATFDMAPPQAQAQLDEARARIRRLGGRFDEPHAAPVRVR